jgi:hypothetical protein
MKRKLFFRVTIGMALALGLVLLGCSSGDDGGGGGGGPVLINIAAIAGVTPPVTGATPVAAITPTAQYTGTVTWSPPDAAFVVSKPYTAIITLTPVDGYTFSGIPANFFTVAGAATVSNSANSNVITAFFPTAASDAAISIAAIAGVTAPVTGAAPVTTITATDQYTGTVSWDPAPPANAFAANIPYTATITLAAKPGYTLTGVVANFFTVAGATATNSADSGVVRAVFPATAGVKGTLVVYNDSDKVISLTVTKGAAATSIVSGQTIQAYASFTKSLLDIGNDYTITAHTETVANDGTENAVSIGESTTEYVYTYAGAQGNIQKPRTGLPAANGNECTLIIKNTMETSTIIKVAIQRGNEVADSTVKYKPIPAGSSSDPWQKLQMQTDYKITLYIRNAAGVLSEISKTINILATNASIAYDEAAVTSPDDTVGITAP